MQESARRNSTPGAICFEAMKKKPSRFWWIVYPAAVALEVIANKAKFGEWRFKAAHRTFAEGMRNPERLEQDKPE